MLFLFFLKFIQELAVAVTLKEHWTHYKCLTIMPAMNVIANTSSPSISIKSPMFYSFILINNIKLETAGVWFYLLHFRHLDKNIHLVYSQVTGIIFLIQHYGILLRNQGSHRYKSFLWLPIQIVETVKIQNKMNRPFHCALFQ